MNLTTTRVMTTAIFCITSFAYGGPCYTDTGSCDTNEQVIVVKPKETGTGFCVETLNDKNQKETKCYYQPPQQIVNEPTTDKETINTASIVEKQQIRPNANLNYTTLSEPIQYTNTPYYYNSDEYYPNERNNNDYYPNDYYNGYYNNQNYFRPHRPRPPRGQAASGVTLNLGGKGHSNTQYRPARPIGGSNPNWGGSHGGGNWNGNHGGGHGGGGNHGGGHGGGSHGGGNHSGGGNHGGDSWKGSSGASHSAGGVRSGGRTTGVTNSSGGGRTIRK